MASSRTLTVLSISGAPQDYALLQSILGAVPSHAEPGCTAGIEFLRGHPVGVVLCDAELPDGTWKDLLGPLSQISDPPSLIVTTPAADQRLWAEVLNLGGRDVLSKPFDPDEVKRAVSLARAPCC